MQSFRDSSAPPTTHPGFMGGVEVGGGASSYPPQQLGPQSSPRIPEEYVGVQSQQHIAPSQHPRPMMPLQTSQAAIMQGYGFTHRGGGGGEALPGDAKHGSGNSTNNHYRKEMMGYYFSANIKDGNRRGGQGLGYGTGFGFSKMDGQVPHQYRPVRTSGSASGMPRYQMDYGVGLASGSGNNSNSGSGSGAFSPSHQYSLGQNPAVQTAAGPQVHLRHRASSFSSHQTLHHGQQQRGYALPGHRFPPVSHYPPNAPTGPVGVYSSSPQRYSGRNGGSFDLSKMNNSSSVASSHNLSLANHNNTGHFDNVGQSYPSSEYLYNSQSSHPVHPHRHSQQNLGLGYDAHKTRPTNLVNQPGLPYPKHPSSSKSSSMNLSVSQFPSQEVSKSPMHSQTQQPQMHQNFSPISNPSPAASVVQSPSCSSSPSPLMGILEGQGSSAGPPALPQSHPPIQKPRSSHGNNRLLQMMNQLSPTPSSNSSSGCGSSGNVSTASLNTNPSNSHSQTCVGVGMKGVVSEEHSSSFYPSSPHDTQILDPGTDSLNALSSQVANLPDTVQRSDFVLSEKRSKDSRRQIQMQQSMHALATDQQRNRYVSASCSTATQKESSRRMDSGGTNSDSRTDEETSQMLESPNKGSGDGEELSETQTEKVISLRETESPGRCPPSQNQMKRVEVKSQKDGGCQGSPVNVEIGASKRQTKTLNSANAFTSEKGDHTDDCLAPSSSLSSCISPSVEHGKFLCPSRPSSSSFSVSPTPSPTSISLTKSSVSPVQTNHAPEESECGQLRNRNEQEGEDGYKTGVGEQKSDIRQGQENDKEIGQCMQNEKDGRHIEKCTKEKESEKENQIDLESSDEPGITVNSKETHAAGGVGVIVSTRSENTQPEAISEQSSTVVSELTHKSDRPNKPGSYNSKQHAASQISFAESSNHNGESRENMMTNPSPHGTKVSHESSVEAWVASHAHSDFQKSSLGYSKFPHSSGTKSIGRPMLSEGGIGTSFRYQGYSQPQHHYSPNLRKNLDIEGRGRNNLGSETEKGQNANKQLQQPFPSLLQEVLQGYHTDKRYGQNERSAQQFQTSNTHDYSHYRYPQSVMDHTRPHVMTSHSRMAMNHHMQPQTSAYEKQYPPKERHESEVCIGQDPSVDSWSVIGAGTKRAQWSTVDKSKMVTSPSHSTSTMQQSADLSVLPHSKQINLTEHSIPSRKLSSNHPATSSAVQQLLLQDTEQTGHSGVTVGLPQNASLSERRSVICDVSPSHPPTPEKLFDGDKGERCNCESQSECHGASVIQQSVTSATVDKESTSSGQDVKTDMKREEKQLDIKKAHHLETSHCNDSPAQENTSKNENTSLPPLDLKPSKDGILNYDKSSPYQPQRPQHSFSNPNTHSSRLHSYFEGTAESNHSVMSVGHGCEEAREGTNRSQNPHHLSQHHDFSSLSQAQNPESTDKLQMYPQSSSLRYSHHLDGWATPNNNQPSSKDLTGSSQQQNRLEGRIQAGMLAPQQQLPQISPHGNYYEKMWGLSSEKEKEGKMGVETFQRQQQTPPAVLPESVANPQIPPSESKLFEQNSSRIISQDIAKSFHRVSDNGDSSGNTVNKTAHGKTRTGGSGETNPLMMRRRVRSFISPIPAKRQHQDVFQQQRGTPSQHSNIASNAVPKHRLTSDPSSPNTAHLNLANQKIHSTTPPQSDSIISPSSSLAKTKILPPRKGRGLKLEAIVQKITPSLKKAANTSSDINMDSASNQLSLTAVAPYSPDTHDQDSADGGNFIRTGAETGSCLPYLSEGLSLDDIMSYRGVEETGPPPPTAYPCDPNQDPHILKCDMMGNMTMGVVRDLEPELDFGLGVSGRPKLDNDCTGERDKDDLQMPPDFSLLGPLPPPPPLPCPVQASPPPSSSGLADIQNFTATYQQLEPRRGEHTAATLLREKLQEGGLVMRMDNYVGRDFFSAKTSHNNQSLGHCLLTSPQRTRLPHHPHHSSAGNLLVGSQFAEAKLENSVPKGYFPSGKKRGRPVGSVNKQKRIQSQPQNLSISALPDSQTSTAAPVAPTPVDTQSTDTINVIHADSPETEKVPTASVSLSNTPQTGKEVVEAEETKPEINVKPRRQRRGKTEESQGGLEQRRRRRGVVGLLAKEDMENAGAGEVSGGAICHGYKKSVFAPYIHVERKLEIGNVCTVVNGDDSGCRWSGKEVGGWASAPLNSTLSSSLVKGDREMDHIKEKRMFENVDTAPVQSSLPGKALPSSGYVLSGAVMTDSSTCGHLLCCLCKKWANYKDLGDLYGPYYPPDYSTKLSKNPPVTRQQGTGKLRSTEANLRTAAAESTNQDSPVAEIQTHASQISKNSAEDQATDLPIDTTVTDTSLIGALDMQCDTDNNGNKDNLLNYLDSVSKLNTMAMDFKPLGELNNLEGQLQSQTVQTEDTQKRPQHRKLTSHPRFKRRHKSNEDLHKSGRTNNKALLPFQPPPPLQLLKQGASDLSAALSMLPQVPLDPEELWVHEGCIVWASGVFLVNGRLYGLQETLDGARDMCCSYCEMVGSTLGCYSKGCTLRYHYLCAIEADCSLNEDNFSLRCPKHKVD